MKIEKTKVGSYFRREDGKGFVLYGSRPDNGKWLERWFPNIEKAKAFCDKKGWPVMIAT